MKFKETKSQERLINLMLQAGVEWPNGCLYAAQDGKSEDFEVGRICGYEKKPVRADDDKSWLPTGSDRACTIMRNIAPLPNWHQTIITREQYEARDGWITWHGGECPVEKGVMVDVMHIDGDVFTGIKVDENPVCEFWFRSGHDGGISAYRIHKPAEQTADDEPYALPVEPCESVRRAIPVEPTIDELIRVWRVDEAAINTARDKACKSRETVRYALEKAGWINGLMDK